MKNFNLDNLEKKTPYKIPENFFEEMQGNVLNKTTKKQEEHQPKIFKLNFSMVSSIAATLAVILGFTFLWKTNQAEITKPVNTTEIAKNTGNETNTTAEIPLENVDTKTISEMQETVENIEKTENNLAENNTEKTTSKEVTAATDVSYEQLLNSLSEEELSELSNNTDQDIYLELYN